MRTSGRSLMTARLAPGAQVVIDLAAAEDDALDVVGVDVLRFPVLVDRLELSVANSSSGETDSLCRSRLFGVKMMSGLR